MCFVFEFHGNILILTGLKLIAMAKVIAWIFRELFDRIENFYQPYCFLRVLRHESLSRIQNFEFPSNARCLQSVSLKNLILPNKQTDALET